MGDYKIGIVGGMGSICTARLMKMINDYINAKDDRDFADIVCLNHASVPDRTDYILGKSDENPVPYILSDIKILEKIGVQHVGIACNTAHSFYDTYTKGTKLNIINMIQLTIKEIFQIGLKKPALFATKGTIKTGIFNKYAELYNLQLVIPDEEEQDAIMTIIYDYLKLGKKPPCSEYIKLQNKVKEKGADSIILGCTELGQLGQVCENILPVIDTLDVLARKIVNIHKELKHKK